MAGVDLSKGHVISPNRRMGSFYFAGYCPECQHPVFVHDTHGSRQVPREFFNICGHDGVDLEVPYPSATWPNGDDLELERGAIRFIFSLFAQQRQALNETLEHLTALAPAEGDQ